MPARRKSRNVLRVIDSQRCANNAGAAATSFALYACPTKASQAAHVHVAALEHFPLMLIHNLRVARN